MTPYRSHGLQIFPPMCGATFRFAVSSVKAFQVDVVPPVGFICCLRFGVTSRKPLPNPMSRNFALCCILGLLASSLTFKSLIYFWVDFRVRRQVRVQVLIRLSHSSFYRLLPFPALSGPTGAPGSRLGFLLPGKLLLVQLCRCRNSFLFFWNIFTLRSVWRIIF